MEIMCLNGWGGKLHEDLLPYIQAAAPDILCLQEVIHSPSSKKDWLTYRDGDHALPQRSNFFRDVSRALPDHVATFCPAAQGFFGMKINRSLHSGVWRLSCINRFLLLVRCKASSIRNIHQLAMANTRVHAALMELGCMITILIAPSA